MKFLLCYGVFTPEQDNDKTNVEPVHSYEAFHTRSDKPGVKGIIGMHKFNICLVVVLLWCENTIRLGILIVPKLLQLVRLTHLPTQVIIR